MVACSNDSGTPDSDNEPLENLPELSVTDVTGAETVSANSSILFKIRVSKTPNVDISFDYTVIRITAEPSVDFTEKTSQAIISARSLTTEVAIEILDDELNEVEEKIELIISNVKNATIKDKNGFGIIKDNDDASFGADGYVNPG